MAYPERLLSDGEVIERQFRPHWSGIFREGLMVLVGVAAAIAVASFGWSGWFYVVIVGAILTFATRGLVRWLTTMHVITNERLIYRSGFIAKQGTEIPLEVIQNVAFNQTLFERIFGTGDLMIESAGTHGQTRYKDIPDPEEVQSFIYRAREARISTGQRGTGVSPSAAGGGDSTVAQLERLSLLHDQGKLSDTEFEIEKAKLLGGSS
jgi:membrane protein YdbS with pleckstrin-like domain